MTDDGSVVVIKGGEGEKIQSGKFPMAGDGWCIITAKYEGTTVGIFIAYLATEGMISQDAQIGGLLPMMLEPGEATVVKTRGSLKNEDYVIYLEEADGPWTITIQRSPVPEPVSGDSTFSGPRGNHVTPYFHLDQGYATFVCNQKAENRSSMGIELINADTGEFVTLLTDNTSNQYESRTETVDVPATGNYIMKVYSSGDWDITYSQ